MKCLTTLHWTFIHRLEFSDEAEKKLWSSKLKPAQDPPKAQESFAFKFYASNKENKELHEQMQNAYTIEDKNALMQNEVSIWIFQLEIGFSIK